MSSLNLPRPKRVYEIVREARRLDEAVLAHERLRHGERVFDGIQMPRRYEHGLHFVFGAKRNADTLVFLT